MNAHRLLEQSVALPPLPAQRAMAQLIARLQRVRALRDLTSQRVGALIPAALNEAFGDLS